MAATASGGAIGDSLYVTESLQNAFEILMCVERVRNIRVAYLLTITYHIIFYHNDNQTFLPVFSWMDLGKIGSRAADFFDYLPKYLLRRPSNALP